MFETEVPARRELQYSSRDPTIAASYGLANLSGEERPNVTQCTNVKVRRLACFQIDRFFSWQKLTQGCVKLFSTVPGTDR